MKGWREAGETGRNRGQGKPGGNRGQATSFQGSPLSNGTGEYRVRSCESHSMQVRQRACLRDLPIAMYPILWALSRPIFADFFRRCSLMAIRDCGSCGRRKPPCSFGKTSGMTCQGSRGDTLRMHQQPHSTIFCMIVMSTQRPNLWPTCRSCPTVWKPNFSCRRMLPGLLSAIWAMRL